MLKNTIITFLISMVPVIELRGALPYGVVCGLPVGLAFAISVLGNLIPAPFIIIYARRLIQWMKTKSGTVKRFADWLERKAERNKEKVLKYEFWGLMILVAIPLPGTGAWTGSLVAAMLDMRLKRAMPAIAIGVIIAGIIVSLMTAGVIVLT